MKKALIFALGLLMLSCAPKGNTAAETASFDQLIHMRRSSGQIL